MKSLGVRPGLWFRPLLTGNHIPKEWQRYTSMNRVAEIYLDPSVPEVLDLVAGDVRTFVDWGYELIKHDFSTYDIFSKWGFEMGTRLSGNGCAFADRTKTTAEIILKLYETIAEAAGSCQIIGCNTIGHLTAGLVQIQRTGDDTSGREWERTRKMGVNTLAFRMPQHGTFFAVDADCVGLTEHVPWERNKLWLELLAESGSPLFLSADPKAVGPEQEAAIRRAFDLAAQPLPPAEPLDWLHDRCPSTWLLNGRERRFDWYGESGVQLNVER
jgi:alpha-galactosidase